MQSNKTDKYCPSFASINKNRIEGNCVKAKITVLRKSRYETNRNTPDNMPAPTTNMSAPLTKINIDYIYRAIWNCFGGLWQIQYLKRYWLYFTQLDYLNFYYVSETIILRRITSVSVHMTSSLFGFENIIMLLTCPICPKRVSCLT